MTVKEMIESLQKLDPEMQVYTWSTNQEAYKAIDDDETAVWWAPTELQKCRGKYQFGARAGKSYTYLKEAPHENRNSTDELVGKPFKALIFHGE